MTEMLMLVVSKVFETPPRVQGSNVEHTGMLYILSYIPGRKSEAPTVHPRRRVPSILETLGWVFMKVLL